MGDRCGDLSVDCLLVFEATGNADPIRSDRSDSGVSGTSLLDARVRHRASTSGIRCAGPAPVENLPQVSVRMGSGRTFLPLRGNRKWAWRLDRHTRETHRCNPGTLLDVGPIFFWGAVVFGQTVASAHLPILTE